MRDVTVVMAYYEQPGMLERQLKHLEALPVDLQEHLEVIIVDDGSPMKPALSVLGLYGKENPMEFPFKFQLWRMDVDIRWNQDACRNLGVKHARNSWVLLTDLDHLIPEATLRSVMTSRLHDNMVYKFARVNDVTLDPYKPHPNSWLLLRSLYEKAGGYDERFAGYYGTDWDFRDRIVRTAHAVMQLSIPLIRVGREHTPDASMPREFGRKSPEDAKQIQALKLQRERNKEGPKHDMYPNHLIFRWPA